MKDSILDYSLGGIEFYIAKQDKEGTLYEFSGSSDYEGVLSYVTLDELEDFAKSILSFCKKESENKND